MSNIKELIRQEIERLEGMDYPVDTYEQSVGFYNALDRIKSFLDTLPDEPEQPTKGYDEAYLNEKIAKASKSWEGVDVDKFMDEIRGREPVTTCDQLEEAARECSKTIYNKPLSGNPQEGYIVYDPDKYDAFIAGAEWGEKNAYKAIMKKADEVHDKRFDTDYEVKIEPAAGFDLGCVNVYREGKLVGQYVEPKEEKKLPEGVEEAAEKSARQYYVDGGYSPFQNTEMASHIAGFIAGAEWMKDKMMEGAVETQVKADLDSHGADYGIRYLYVRMPDNSPIGDKVSIIVLPKEDAE